MTNSIAGDVMTPEHQTPPEHQAAEEQHLTARLADMEKQLATVEAEQQALEAANARLERIVALSPEARALFDMLPPEKQDEYLRGRA